MKIGTVLFMIVLTVTAIVLAAALAAVFNPKVGNKAGPDWIWSLRKFDPLRNVFFKADGSFRRYGRLILSIFLALALLGVLYVLIASSWTIFGAGS
jgi:hypothetical protein